MKFRTTKNWKISFRETSIINIISPFTLTHIDEYAFNNCCKLHRIDFLTISQLQSIGRNTFFYSSKEYFSVPHHLTQIYVGILKEIIITNNYELILMEKNTFIKSLIESISIKSLIVAQKNKIDFKLHQIILFITILMIISLLGKRF